MIQHIVACTEHEDCTAIFTTGDEDEGYPLSGESHWPSVICASHRINPDAPAVDGAGKTVKPKPPCVKCRDNPNAPWA